MTVAVPACWALIGTTRGGRKLLTVSGGVQSEQLFPASRGRALEAECVVEKVQ